MIELLRIVMFGMRGVGSGPALRALLRHGYQVEAVVMPGPPGLRTLPPLTRRSTAVPMAPTGDGLESETSELFVDEVARTAGVPVLLVGGLQRPEVIGVLTQLASDVIVASCFPWRVPPEILRLPRLGCLNVHPSLLPDGKGSDPVSESLRRGDTVTGVTVHLMDEDFDSGPIVVQEVVPVPPDARPDRLERELAERGARLLNTAIDGLSSQRLTPIPQDEWLVRRGGTSIE